MTAKDEIKMTKKDESDHDSDSEEEIEICDTCGKECEDESLSNWCEVCRDKDECKCDTCGEIKKKTAYDSEALVVFCKDCGKTHGFKEQ